MKTIFLTGISRGIGNEIFKLLEPSYNFIGTTRDVISFKHKFPHIFEKTSLKIIEIDFDIFPNEKWSDYINRIAGIIDLINLNIDIFINNSGVAHFAPFVELDEQFLRNEYFVNSIAPSIIMKSVVEKMIIQKSGLIINISSIATKKVFENSSIYTATKNSIIGLTNSLREEIRKHNLKLVNIFLGATNTDIWDHEIRKSKHHRMISASNIAKVIKQIIELSELEDLMIEEIVIKPQLGDL